MRFSFDTDLGWITIGEEEGQITEVGFYDCGQYEGNRFLLKAKVQIEEYLAGDRKIFDLPIKLKGTDFQKRIWEFLRAIPYGETTTYADAARAADQPKGARAAGGAVGNNPIAIIVPCHRVMGSNGKIRGYRYGIKLKEKLLKIEKSEG